MVAESRFCHQCGAAWDGAAPSTPGPVHSPAGERRVASVLFADLVGFTPLSETRDAEEVRDLLSRYFAECRTVIARYGGTVQKFIGDAVMAVWGVPTTHEDDAERAVRAGLELVETVAALGEELGAPGLAIRVGIVTAEVAVAFDLEGEGLVAGDAVNTASRVQSVAGPGLVWVDEGTRAATSRAIAYADAGEHTLKGKAEPVALWEARAAVAAVGGAQRVDGLEAPLVGRDRQLRLVKELFHGTEEARRPRLVVIDGDPGVGKSRLAWEFEKYVDGLSATVRWHRGRCLSYGDGVAFWALAEALRARFGLVEADSGDVVGQALDERLEQFVPDADERTWLRPRLATLLGAPGAGTFTRDDLFAAWTAFFERLGQDGTAVVWVVDDAQYADEGLLDFLDHLLATARAGIFVLALARPELLTRRPTLGGRRSDVIRLDLLDGDAMRRLVDGLVMGLPADARDALANRSEGVPLFAVETVRALIDRDLVVPRDGVYVPADGSVLDLDAIGAPATLQALVAARLDGLTAAERQVVADASVLGVTFTRQALKAISAPGLDHDEVLSGLQRKEIVRVEEDLFSAERGQYRFVQSVVRQVAYATQSRRDRKARHLAAADFLERRPDAGEELAVVIAQHLLDAIDASAAGDDDVDELRERATALLEKAGRRALAVGAPSEAKRLFVSALSRTEDAHVQADLHLAAASAAVAAGDYDDAIDHAREATQLFDDLGRQVDAGLAVAEHGRALIRLGDNAGAQALTEPRYEQLAGVDGADVSREQLAGIILTAVLYSGDGAAVTARWGVERLLLAERTGSSESLVDALVTLGLGFHSQDAPVAGGSLYAAAVDLARQRQYIGRGYVRALNNVATITLSRDLDEASEAAAATLEAAQRIGDRDLASSGLLMQLQAWWIAGRLSDLREGLDRARDVITAEASDGAAYAQLALSVAEACGADIPPEPPWWDTDDELALGLKHNVRAQYLAHAADAEAAVEHAQKGVHHLLAATGVDDTFFLDWPSAMKAVLAVGAVDAAAELLEPVEAAPAALRSPGLKAQLARYRGLVGAARGDDPRAVEEHLRSAIAQLTAFGWLTALGRTQEDLGHWLVAQGRGDEGGELLAAARASYVQMGATGWVQALPGERTSGTTTLLSAAASGR